MCVSVVAVLAAGMLLTPAAGAQAPVAADVCTTLAPSADSADVVVHLVLDRWRLPGMASPRHSPGERAALALILQEVRQGLVFPLPLSFRPSLASGIMDVKRARRGVRRESVLTAPIPSRSIAFTLHADGRISDVSFRDTLEVAPLDAALLAALRGKSKAPEMQTLIHDLATDSVLLELRTEYDR